MLEFTANPRMLRMIVIFFMCYDEQGAQLLMDVYKQMKKDGLV